MARAGKNTNPTGKGGFKPGQSGNPLGGKLHDPALKALANLTKHELVEIGNIIVKSSYEDLLAMQTDYTLTSITHMVIAQAVKAIRNQDSVAFETLLNRLVGKVKDEVLHQGQLIQPPKIILTLPDNGSNALPAKKVEVLEEDYGF